MTTIYPVFSPVGNYLDGYYVDNYADFIEELISKNANNKQVINLGITDGVSITNNLQGDWTGYNSCVVVQENGTKDFYKITDKQFIRKGVWNITMVIDAFSKYYNETLASDILVKRIGISNRSTFNPILFGDENVELSQIKVRQIPLNFSLFDNSTFATMVENGNPPKGYLMFIQSDALDNGNMEVSIPADESISPDYTVSGIENFVLYNKALHKDTTVSIKYDSHTSCYYFYKWEMFNKSYYEFYTDSEGWHRIEYINKASTTVGTKSNYKGYGVWEDTGYFDYTDNKPDIDPAYLFSVLTDYANRQLDELDYDSYKQYENKTVLDSNTGIIYRINFGSETIESKELTLTDQDTLNQAFQATALDYEGYGIGLLAEYSRVQISIVATGETATTITASIKSGIRKTSDEGFYVLYIPYYNIPTSKPNQSPKGYVNYSLLKRVIDKFREVYGGENGKILDIQETYFTPTFLKEYFLWTGSELQIIPTDNTTYCLSQTSGIIHWIAFALDSCAGVITTETNLQVSDFKLEQQNRYILKSPSGATSYDFSLAKNNGVSGFNLKYNLRPYASMYQVQPIYKGYYGQNYCDTRGLVMLEDTSITQRSDIYETYKRQNVNYITSFNSNQTYERNQLELQQGAERRNKRYETFRDITNAVGEAGQSAIGYNAMGKAYGFNGAGMGAASAVGIIVGETVDQVINWKQFLQNQRTERQRLAMSQSEARKQWELTLGNMAALPTNTDKVSGIYNTNYGTYYIEIYNPTNYEIEVYKNYLDLFGVGVGFMIDLTTYDFNYLEGNIIKFSTAITAEEYEEINIELNSGRRLYVSNEQENEETT